MMYYICSPDTETTLFNGKQYATVHYQAKMQWIGYHYGYSNALLVENLDDDVVLLLTLRDSMFSEVTTSMFSSTLVARLSKQWIQR